MDTIEVKQNPRTSWERVKGSHKCAVEPVQDAWGRWSYPWSDMQPGGVFFVPDPSLAARTRLATAASAVRRRTGQCFATGPAIDDKGVRWGWWCCRWDGCEILPIEKTMRQEFKEKEVADRKWRKRRNGFGVDSARVDPVKPMGTFAIGIEQPEQEPLDHEAWMRPRDADEVF